MSREAKILTAILVVVVGGLIGVFALANQAGSSANVGPRVDAATLLKSDSHQEGSGSVQVVEFGDYECPACGAAFPYVQQILKDYSGKITFYFRNFPLTSLHPNALAAAHAAEEAGDLGKFWQMHDLLYQKQSEWGELPKTQAIAKFGDYANSLGIDGSKVVEAATNQTEKARVTQDMTDGSTLGINATPTFYVAGHQVETTTEQGLRDAIDAAIKAKK